AWFATVGAGQQVELAKEVEASTRRTAGFIKERYEQGLRTPLDHRLAENAAAVASSQRIQREVARDAVVRQLEILLGRYPSNALESKTVLPAAAQPVSTGLPAELLARRPDLRASWHRVKSADARVDQAWAERLPRIALTAGGGRSSDSLSDL